MDDSGFLKDAEVLGDGLTSESGAVGELRDGARRAPRQAEDETEAGLVAKGSEVGGVAAETGGGTDAIGFRTGFGIKGFG